MFYSPEEKRKIILDNFRFPTKQVELEKLKEISQECQVPFFTFRNSAGSCGDILHLLVKIKGSLIEKICFAGQQSCLITVSSSNILCSYLEGRSLETGREIITNCQNMIKGEEYFLDNHPNLKVFYDITHFPHRVECLNLVMRAMFEIISE
jgi:nitrogen fixation NifU-like protein